MPPPSPSSLHHLQPVKDAGTFSAWASVHVEFGLELCASEKISSVVCTKAWKTGYQLRLVPYYAVEDVIVILAVTRL